MNAVNGIAITVLIYNRIQRLGTIEKEDGPSVIGYLYSTRHLSWERGAEIATAIAGYVPSQQVTQTSLIFTGFFS